MTEPVGARVYRSRIVVASAKPELRVDAVEE
jgi:hypothetical protein